MCILSPEGRVSFTSAGRSLYDEAQQTLHEMHPQYDQLVQDHIVRDPARVLRRRVDIARLIESVRPKLLFITSAADREIKAQVEDLANLLEDDYEILLLRPYETNLVSLDLARLTNFLTWRVLLSAFVLLRCSVVV